MSFSSISTALESKPGIPGIRRGPLQLGMLSGEADPDALIATLSRALVNQVVTSDIILGAIAEAAQSLTNAAGAALAVQSEGGYVCRSRSGDIAPSLGAQLKLDSGISGECLRTGNALRCDDTQNDYRVDPEVCFRMGIRSIAVTPLRGRRGPIGILEVFSNHSNAFTTEHADFLNRLAVIAEAAQEPSASPLSAPLPYVETHPAEIQEWPAEGTDEPQVLESPAQAQQGASFAKWKAMVIATAALIFLIAAVFFLWRGRSAKPLVSNVQSMPATTPVPQQSTPIPATNGRAWRAPGPAKPSPAVSANRSISHGGKIGIADITRHPLRNSKAADSTSTQAAKSSSENEALNLTPPALSPVSTDKTSALGNLLPNQVVLPKFAAPVSKGVSEPVIEHKVQPAYPPQAFAMRLEGQVVLMAMVSEKGKVESVKVISGNAILAQAAADAVRQWHYRPFLLDGKPIPMQTQITLNFKAP